MRDYNGIASIVSCAHLAPIAAKIPCASHGLKRKAGIASRLNPIALTRRLWQRIDQLFSRWSDLILTVVHDVV